MKSILFLLLSLLGYSLTAQISSVHVVFAKDADPVRAYTNMVDYGRFIENKPFFAQEVRIYGEMDSTEYKLTINEQIYDIYHVEYLPDKFLSKKTVFVVIQRNHNLADRVFTNLEECKKYAANWQERYLEIPLSSHS